MLVGNQKQGAPIVRSDSAEANVFGPQLAMSPFLRFILSGFPLEHLWEQHRMVEILCSLPSRRVYDGLLRTSREACIRRMTLEQNVILTNLRQFDPSTLRYPSNKERAYVEDQHSRHWLLDVRGGRTKIDSALQKSRLNVMNVDITLKFVKALVKFCFLPPRYSDVL